MRSPLSSLVTSMVSSPRINFNSLWILKGDLSATFADPFELITINFLNVDQSTRGDTLIKVGRSSAFLLLATEAAPRANKAPTLWGWASQLFPAPEGYGG
ncbi:hypothetical protein PoB_007651300 [Plakobranchus ocellatus]|uniref:Uncharacterized protein n=1 Tax=Plakobranchus ocellatus TaxID=259542 RepID=A0AAV4E090_9GAST|nr:hypothetical protein PoB_007651300 [Plakobranchus ocellatus]